jgi:uncharacterized protein
MNTSPLVVDELPLLDLFNALREAQFPLGIDDYYLGLKAIHSGKFAQNRESLKRLCRALWVKSNQERLIFEQQFDVYISFDQRLTSEQYPASDQMKKPFEKVETEIVKKPDWRESFKQFAVRAAPWMLILLGLFLSFYLWQVFGSKTSKVPSGTTSNPDTEIPKNSTQTPLPKQIQKLPIPEERFLVNTVSQWWLWIGGAFLLGGIGALFFLLRKRPAFVKTTQQQIDLSMEPEIFEVARRTKLRQVIGSDLCLPLGIRQVKQSWRFLRRRVRQGILLELDIPASIDQLVRDGVLLSPVLVPRLKNQSAVLFLLDWGGSMSPFHAPVTALVEAARFGGGLGASEVFYFHNVPGRFVFEDPKFLSGAAFTEVLARARTKRMVVLICSDAGAARGSTSIERLEETQQLLNTLRKYVRQVVCLNPMPRERWQSTSAAEIAEELPMFEMTQQGLDSAISVLRGRKQLAGKQW